jgi:hypothetical protein
MNWYKLFYWLTVADNAKTMFVTFTVIFTLISGVATIAYFANMDDVDEQKMSRKWMWWSYPFMILFWSLYIFTPNKKDALLIVAGGGTMEFLTTDSTVKQIPHELSSFVVTQLKSMGEEAKVELGIQSQKDKILDEAKSMTTQQLLDKMKVDTNFANIILNK